MDLERGLLTKLIDEDRLNSVTRSGLNDDFLRDQECKTVFAYISRHYSEYQKTPSRDALKQVFPNFDFVTYSEPLEFFIEQIKESFRKDVLQEALHKAVRLYDSDTKAAESLLKGALSDLSITSKTFKDVDLANSALQRIQDYEERQQNPGADGILSRWDKVDYLTLGWHPEEFVVLVGEKYMGKSWLMLWLAYQAMLQGERVLFVTKEMSQEALARRFDSIYASVKFDSLRRGELSDVEFNRYKNKLSELAESDHRIVLARHGVSTIEEAEQKAVECDSTIVFIDSVYLFNPDHKNTYTGEVQRRGKVSERCKSLAATLGIPVIVSTQAGRRKSKGEKLSLDSIEWSNAFSQDADTVLMIEKTEIDRELNRVKLDVLKSRDGDIGSCYIRTDFEYMTFKQDVAEVEPSTHIEIEEEETMLDG